MAKTGNLRKAMTERNSYEVIAEWTYQGRPFKVYDIALRDAMRLEKDKTPFFPVIREVKTGGSGLYSGPERQNLVYRAGRSGKTYWLTGLQERNGRLMCFLEDPYRGHGLKCWEDKIRLVFKG